jgi:hypothetical protein
VDLAAGTQFWDYLQMNTEHYLELADQALDRMLTTNVPSERAEYVARAQVHALRAIASAVDRLTRVVEAHRPTVSD